jgi:hypothetical protein
VTAPRWVARARQQTGWGRSYHVIYELRHVIGACGGGIGLGKERKLKIWPRLRPQLRIGGYGLRAFNNYKVMVTRRRSTSRCPALLKVLPPAASPGGRAAQPSAAVARAAPRRRTSASRRRRQPGSRQPIQERVARRVEVTAVHHHPKFGVFNQHCHSGVSVSLGTVVQVIPLGRVSICSVGWWPLANGLRRLIEGRLDRLVARHQRVFLPYALAPICRRPDRWRCQHGNDDQSPSLALYPVAWILPGRRGTPPI